MVFGAERDLLKVVEYFMDFFIEESCGYCTPCRVGNVLLKNRLENIMQGVITSYSIHYTKLYETAYPQRIAGVRPPGL